MENYVFKRLWFADHYAPTYGIPKFFFRKNGAAECSPMEIYKSAGFPGCQILTDHQCHTEHDGMIELAKIQAGELADLFQTVNQGVTVDKQLSGSLRDVQIVLEELVDGEQRLLIRESMEFFLNTSLRKISHRVVGSW